MQKNGNGTAGKAGFRGIGAAGKDDGDARTEDDAGELRAAQIFELLGEHVATLEVGDDQDVGLPGDGRAEMLDFGGLDADCSVEGQGAIEDTAGDLAAVGHLAEGGGFHAWRGSSG